MNLSKLFAPKTIALVGASPDEDSLGFKLWEQLKETKGVTVFPVNPKYKEIGGKKAFAELSQIPGELDQAIIAIPAPIVPMVAAQAVSKKVKSLVVISAGFSESGPDGRVLELQLKKETKGKLLMLGPNCFGYANPALNLNTTFAKAKPPTGSIGLISQSGAIGAFLFDWAKRENLGFSKFASLGNRAGVTESELIDYLVQDPDTKVISLYLESFADGKEFLLAASRASRVKPVVVLFGGVTAAGKTAASSHTASLSPKIDVIATALSQSGCIQASDLDQFTDLLEMFALEPPLTDNDLMIVTNAGGPGILAADATAAAHLKLDQPVDLLGDATAKRFQTALSQLLKDHTKDAYLIILTPQSMSQLEETAQILAKTFKHLGKPVVVSLLGAESVIGADQILSKNGLATIEFPQKAVSYLGILYKYYHQRLKRLSYPARQGPRKPLKQEQKLKLLGLLTEGLLSWPQSSLLAKVYKLPLADTRVVTSSNLNSTIKNLGWPLVLKVDPSQAVHRTEVKGLYLNLKTVSAVSKAYRELSAKFKMILAQQQVSHGIELFIGFKREGTFPALMTLGSGGIYTEIYQDVAHAFLPLNAKLVADAIDRTKVGEIIKGARGLPPLASKNIVEMILALGQMMQDWPQIEEMDINPAIIDQHSVVIVDIKIKITKPTHP